MRACVDIYVVVSLHIRRTKRFSKIPKFAANISNALHNFADTNANIYVHIWRHVSINLKRCYGSHSIDF